MREKASQGERGAEIGNRVLARNRKLCRLSTVAVGSETKCSPIIEGHKCRVGRVENITEDDQS